MRLPFRPKPQTLADRAKAVADDAIDRARSLPDRLEGSRERAIAVAGAVAGVAAGLAFWRSRGDDEPSVDHPAAPAAPWKMPPPDVSAPEAADGSPTTVADAAAEASGSRSK